MLGFGGGGHQNAGTCQVAHEDAEAVLDRIAALVNQPVPVP
jgi:nanoRNase/pAp phosphatase (c-di-AMP/oligoRNAs hydrolase)